MLETIRTDILIIGSGGAGLFAALFAKKANRDLDITIAVSGYCYPLAVVCCAESAFGTY